MLFSSLLFCIPQCNTSPSFDNDSCVCVRVPLTTGQVAMEGNRVEFIYSLQNKGRTTLKSVTVSEKLSGLEKSCNFYQNGNALFSTGTYNHSPKYNLE